VLVVAAVLELVGENRVQRGVWFGMLALRCCDLSRVVLCSRARCCYCVLSCDL
jgi:hypothetical protein